MTLVELLQQAASESDTPNTSIEGKAANLIERQAAQIEMMRSTLHGIVDADWRKLEELASPEEFVRWAKSRANHVLSTTPDQALEQFAVRVREQCAKMCEAEYVNVADGDDEVYNSAITHASRGIRAIKELP